jgi:hypothetical protein
MANKDKTIFITIPAYNDPALLDTLARALGNSLYPNRLYFCIGMQYDDDKMPNISQYLSNPNFSFIFYDVNTRPGVYWIRKEMAERHTGQDYFLMIDSHMKFARHWDAKLINDYEGLVSLHGSKTIMSSPLVQEPGNTHENGMLYFRSSWDADWNNDKTSIERTIVPGMVHQPWEGDRYQKTVYCCSHFFFTNKDYLSDVGFFQRARSYSEEYTISVTSFLSGWDCYHLPEFAHLGHDDTATVKAIYGKERYSIADGKKSQAIFETEEEKLEIEKFVLLDRSSLFTVKNQRRGIDEFYEQAGEKIQNAREKLIQILGL